MGIKDMNAIRGSYPHTSLLINGKRLANCFQFQLIVHNKSLVGCCPQTMLPIKSDAIDVRITYKMLILQRNDTLGFLIKTANASMIANPYLMLMVFCKVAHNVVIHVFVGHILLYEMAHLIAILQIDSLAECTYPYPASTISKALDKVITSTHSRQRVQRDLGRIKFQHLMRE